MLQASNLDFNGVSRALNLPAPASANEPVRKTDLDAAIEGLKHKDTVSVAAQVNVNIASPGATVDGVTLTSGDRVTGSVLLRSQTVAAENGIYIWNGAAVPMTRTLDANASAELNNALVPIASGTDAGKIFRQTTTVVTLGTDAVTFAAFGTTAAQATHVQAGIARLATSAELNVGTDDTTAITPAVLATWTGKVGRAQAVIGDGTATQIDVTHNLNSYDVHVIVRLNGGTNAVIGCDVSYPTVNTVRLNFAAAPAANAYRVVVIG